MRGPVPGLVLVLTLVLGACGPAASPEEAAANQEILDGIADRLATQEGVTEVTATFVDNADAPARAAISVECGTCDAAAVHDASVRAVWTSEVTPLLGISVRVNVADPVQTRIESFIVREDEAELTEKYGERSVPSLPDDD